MKRNNSRPGSLAAIAILLLTVQAPAGAQTGGNFNLTWNTLSGAGARSTGGSFSLTGTIEQPLASPANGGGFSLTSGFWFGGNGVIGIADPETPGAPAAALAFHVSKATPNPFNPRTSVVVEVADAGRMRADVIDISGRIVRKLVDEDLVPGKHPLVWDGRDDSHHEVGSGVYFLQVVSGNHTHTQKLALVR